jgi:peptidoglycan/LPS O-acetylase OafA/YrhL
VLAFRVQLDGGAFPYEGGFLVVALLTAVVVADQASAAPSGVATVLRHPVAVLIGRWSYTLYLVHLPIVQLLSRTDLPATEQLVLDLVLSFAAAAAVSLGIEQPALRLKRRLSASPEPSPPGAAGVGLATAGALPVPVGGTPDLRPAARMSGDGHDGPDPPPAPPSA